MKNELEIVLKALNPITAKDSEDRQPLKGILLDKENECCVAIDGRFLVCVPFKVTGKTRILAGRKIKAVPAVKWHEAYSAIPFGEVVKATYPNYKLVLPPQKEGIEINLEATLEALTKAIEENVDKDDTPVVSIPLFKDGKRVEGNSKADATKVLKALKALQNTGSKKISYESPEADAPSGELHPLTPFVLLGDNGGMAVIMCMKVEQINHPLGIFLMPKMLKPIVHE